MQKKTSNNIKGRAWTILCVVFLLGFLFLIVRLFQLQVIDGPMYKAWAMKQRSESSVLAPKRGSIYDRNEKVLAQSAVVWNVFISPEELVPEQIPDIAKNLAEILEVPVEDILTKADNPGSYYQRIKMKIDDPKRRQVETYMTGGYQGKRIKGIYFEEDTKRYYPFDHRASTVIGFTNDINQGSYGLEAYYDSILAGTPGINVSDRNPQGLDMPGQLPLTFAAQDGYSIVLTIDETIQGILEKHMEMAVVEHGVKNRAVGIVMNIKTGEILAMSSKPDFDPNFPLVIYDPVAKAALENLVVGSIEYDEEMAKLRIAQWSNKAITGAYEPGSVYKIVTASIALEEQRSFLNDTFFCSGSIEVADRTINCHRLEGHGQQNFYDIMRNSCNPAFVTLGLRNDPPTTYNYMTDFGLGKPTGIDLPGEEGGILHTANSLASQGQVPLASTSFGQSFTTTPIQLITAVSAAVNGGYLVEPYVVHQIRDSKGNVIETIQPKVKRQVISAETSEEIQILVEQVVNDGTGKHAAIPGYRIGGKTGTSEILTAKAGAPKEYVLSFVGFAPMDDPVYACLIALDEPNVDNPLGSVIAAPVVGAILQEMLPYVGIDPFFTEAELAQKPVVIPYLVAQKPHDAQANLTALGLKTKLMGQGKNVLLQVPLAQQTLQKGGTVTLFTDEDSINAHIVLPDLTEKTAEEARQILLGLNLNVEIRGVTTRGVPVMVGQQWPEVGEKAASADVVILTMVEDTRGEALEGLGDLPLPPASTTTADGDGENEWPTEPEGEISLTEEPPPIERMDPTSEREPEPPPVSKVPVDDRPFENPVESGTNSQGEKLDGGSFPRP